MIRIPNFKEIHPSLINLLNKFTLLIAISFGISFSPIQVIGQVNSITLAVPKATPTITVSKTSLDFEKVYSGYYSLPQSYLVTGSNLTEAIVVTAPTGIEITKTCGSGYSNTVSLTPTSGSVSATVYARYTGGAVSTSITHTHTGATTASVSISEAANATNLPGTYYSTATGTGATLKTNLYNIIKGHTSRTYANLWTDFQTTDKKPDGSVWDMYTDIPCGTPCVMTYTTNQDDGTGGTAECQKYNREHSWPNSWFGGDVAANEASIAYTDLFHLIPTDKYVNNARGNYIIGEVTVPTKTFVNGGLIGPNNVSGSGYTGTVFEPNDNYKGDFARAYFYMVTRYQPDQAAWESITTDGDVIMDGTTYPSIEPWVLSMLISWNTLDPVDQKEKSRNDAIYTLQGNRNPFIDNPNYVSLVWVTTPTLSVLPSSLSGFTYSLGSGPSTAQTFVLSGANLTGFPSNITITAPTNFEVSTDGTTFAASKTVSYTSATLANTTIYVRLKTALGVNTYSGNITLTGGGDTDGATVSVSGSVTAIIPTLTVAPTTLIGFTYISGAGPSSEQSFSLSGNYLTGFPSNITLTAPTGFELSLTSGGTFASNVSVPYTSATLSATLVYVRLAAGLPIGSNSGNITISGGGDADGATLALTGNVTSASSSCFTNGGFDGGTTAPTGWIFFNIGGTYTSAGNYGVASPSLKFDATGDSITTPDVSGATQLSFWYKGQTTTGSLKVEGFNGSWSTIETIVLSADAAAHTKVYNSSSSPVLNTGFTKFKISYTKTTSNVALDDVTVTCSSVETPILLTTPTTLSGFTYVAGAGPSAQQSYSISGTNLNGGNVTITASANYEISQTSGSGFVSTALTLTAFNGTATTIYVRLKAGLSAGNYNSEIIANAGDGATTVNVTCSGTVTSAPTPILAVTPTSLNGFTYVQGAGPSAQQSYSISGTNLNGGNVTITPSVNYEISQTSGSGFVSTALTLTAFNGTATTIYVRLKSGLIAGNYNSEIIANAGGGATTVNVTCSGTVTAASSSCATDLIISEYIEGNGNNKYIEIYNGTSASINLADYQLRLFANGALTATSDIALSGIIASNGVVIYENSGEVLSVAGTSNAACNFNGDDAISLYKISTTSYVDIIGRIGEDPGTEWVSGTLTTLDKTLVRKSTVFQGVTTNPASGFPTLATEWDVYNIDDITHLGSHTMSCPFIITVGTLSSFGSQTINTFTAEQTYTVAGVNLTSNIIITPPANFQISTTSGANFISSPSTITLSLAKGNISAQTIYVRMNPTSAGSISGDIINASNNTAPVDLSVNGFGIDVTPMFIELTSFTAVCHNNQVEIHWSTASETNNSHFILERSNDSKSWQQISQITGAGNSSTIINYTYTDKTALDQGMYRLIQVDFDGKSTTYNPIAVNCVNGTETNIEVYPNPFNDQLTIKISGADEVYDITLLDIDGKVILENKNITTGIYDLNTSSLAPGVYALKVKSNSGVEVIKVVRK